MVHDDLLRDYMRQSIDLALQGIAPELRGPFVGAIVLDAKDEIAGRGYKSLVSGTKLLRHAERMALDEAEEAARGGTIITTLEPCGSVKGKNQLFAPCSELIVSRGIRKVVYGLNDYSDTFDRRSGQNYMRVNGLEVVHDTQFENQIRQVFAEKFHRLRYA